jgi:hypothetical protein
MQRRNKQMKSLMYRKMKRINRQRLTGKRLLKQMRTTKKIQGNRLRPVTTVQFRMMSQMIRRQMANLTIHNKRMIQRIS